MLLITKLKAYMRIALLVPHMFMQAGFLNDVIFSPGFLAIELANGLSSLGHEVTLFAPGEIGSLNANVNLITGDFSLIDKELESRGYSMMELMQKHPLTFITLSRQVQADLISKAYSMANENKFDIVHVYINEEDVALEFAKLCKKLVVFTHHEPFNYLTKYRTSFAKFKNLNWISISLSQRKSIDSSMNWVGNVYHGIRIMDYELGIKKVRRIKPGYFAYFGRIIEPKGVHLAIKAVKKYNETVNEKMQLRIAGKHYGGESSDSYWKSKVEPYIDNKEIFYEGFISDEKLKREFLGNAKALLVPSTWNEPFGMVCIEAMSEGTPVIGLDNGALPEIIKDGVNGFICKTSYKKVEDEVSQPSPNENTIDVEKTVDNMVKSMNQIRKIDREKCFEYVKEHFNIEKMVEGYEGIYEKLIIEGEVRNLDVGGN